MDWLSAEAQKGDHLNHKKLEQVKGFLVYVSITYPFMTPYLKGICLTLKQCRGGIDEDGWHLLESELKGSYKNS